MKKPETPSARNYKSNKSDFLVGLAALIKELSRPQLLILITLFLLPKKTSSFTPLTGLPDISQFTDIQQIDYLFEIARAKGIVLPQAILDLKNIRSANLTPAELKFLAYTISALITTSVKKSKVIAEEGLRRVMVEFFIIETIERFQRLLLTNKTDAGSLVRLLLYNTILKLLEE